MQLTGIIIHIENTQQISETFKKREFVVKTDEQYPQEIKFDLHQDKTELINNYKINDKVTVDYNLTGRSFTTKDGKTAWNNTIKAWKITKSI